MKRNRKKLLELADHLEKHPDEYNQNQWGPTGLGNTYEEAVADAKGCGGAFCLAGTTAALNGARPHVTRNFHDDWVAGWSRILAPVDDFPHGRRECLVEDYAADVLGLEPWEALVLFDSNWEPKKTVHAAVKSLAYGAHVRNVSADHIYIGDPDAG